MCTEADVATKLQLLLQKLTSTEMSEIVSKIARYTKWILISSHFSSHDVTMSYCDVTCRHIIGQVTQMGPDISP